MEKQRNSAAFARARKFDEHVRYSAIRKCEKENAEGERIVVDDTSHCALTTRHRHTRNRNLLVATLRGNWIISDWTIKSGDIRAS